MEQEKYKYYSNYIFKNIKILQGFFGLSEIPVKIDESYFNCGFVMHTPDDKNKERNFYFVFAIYYMHNVYINERKEREKRYGLKLHSFEELVLRIILHELGHYKDLSKIGANNYIKRHISELTLLHSEREAEKIADNFSIGKYKQAEGIVKNKKVRKYHLTNAI